MGRDKIEVDALIEELVIVDDIVEVGEEVDREDDEGVDELLEE